jgi:methyl-accepting chemotaxis protein
MNRFLDFSTRSKLLISFGLPVVLLLVVSATSYRSIKTLQESQSNLYQKDIRDALELLNFRAENNAARAAMLSLFVSRTQEQAVLIKDLQDRSERLRTALNTLIDSNRDEPVFLSRLQELRELNNALENTRRNEALPLLAQGRRDEAQVFLTGVQEQRFVRSRELSRELSLDKSNHAETAIKQTELLAEQTKNLIFFLGLVALGLSLLLAWWLSGLLARPVAEMAQIAERVATGDLSPDLPESRRRDEVGVLGQAFRRMLIGLRLITSEIQEGINVLASSSSEILAATAQVAAGAVESATAVSQTTATVEQVKQTAQVTNDKAKYVSESAGRAAQISSGGRKAVDELIESMTSIREQMESIGARIVNLSEHSQVIGDIVMSVDDLAEQTNLLAVNAAIEAAKAGEHGRGFAVVAQEIRNLAEQSKQATSQVRSILTEIQKATAATALAAEQGSRTVEAGFKRSSEAKDAIRQLADSIAAAAHAATQIAASSQQQTIGMEQVALAMGNIRQASQQNASSTKQAEAAARSLYELGQKLKQIVEQYKL